MRALTVELNKDKDEVFIHGSPEGLRYLAQQLNAIATAAEQHGKSHDHFMTEQWGGKELSSELQGSTESSSLVNHLIVYGWKKGD